MSIVKYFHSPCFYLPLRRQVATRNRTTTLPELTLPPRLNNSNHHPLGNPSHKTHQSQKKRESEDSLRVTPTLNSHRRNARPNLLHQILLRPPFYKVLSPNAYRTSIPRKSRDSPVHRLPRRCSPYHCKSSSRVPTSAPASAVG